MVQDVFRQVVLLDVVDACVIDWLLHFTHRYLHSVAYFAIRWQDDGT